MVKLKSRIRYLRIDFFHYKNRRNNLHFLNKSVEKDGKILKNYGGCFMTRLEVLIKVIDVNKEQISTRNQMKESDKIDIHSSEFFVKEGNIEYGYDVLKGDEIEARLEECLSELHTEEELIEIYGLDESGNLDLSSADIETYLTRIATVGEYTVYQAS